MARHSKKAGKNRTKRKIKGGMKRINPSLRSNFDAILEMIRTPGARLTKVSGTSLKGFLFKLEIPPVRGTEQFLGVNPEGTDFSVAVYSLVFKFCVASEEVEELEPLVLKKEKDPIRKETELLRGFYEEAKTQQEIFRYTLQPSGKNICPAIVDFSFFDSSSANVFLQSLIPLAPAGPVPEQSLLSTLKKRVGFREPLPQKDDALTMLEYLLRNVVRDKHLGLIIMELVDRDYGQLETQLDDAREAQDILETRDDLSSADLSGFERVLDIYDDSCRKAAALLLVQAIKCNKFPIDCHFGNILANSDGSKALLIDFGRILSYINLRTKEVNLEPFPQGISGMSPRDEIVAVITRYNEVSKSDYYEDIEEILSFDPTDLWVDDAPRRAAVKAPSYAESRVPGERREKDDDEEYLPSDEEMGVVERKDNSFDAVLERVHKIMKFMSCIDYACMSIFYPDLEEQTPQMVELIINIYDHNLTRNWLPLERRQRGALRDEPPPNWVELSKSPHFRSNVVEILRTFRQFTEGFVRGVINPLSSDALERASQSRTGPGSEPSLFSARPDMKEHDRTRYFTGSPPKAAPRRKGGAKTFKKSGFKKTRMRRKNKN